MCQSVRLDHPYNHRTGVPGSAGRGLLPANRVIEAHPAIRQLRSSNELIRPWVNVTPNVTLANETGPSTVHSLPRSDSPWSCAHHDRI
jgi:hypothetical protein